MNASQPANASSVRFVSDEPTLRLSYPLIRQLRPHLVSVENWIQRYRRQAADGYRVAVLMEEGRPVALGGFRLQENLVYGRFLYVDDLVTDEAVRGNRHGEKMIDALKAEALAAGCAKLVLDTAIGNSLAHRFYFRSGLLALGLRFSMPLAS